MLLSCMLKRGRIYEFPFWAGAIALGWFFPQAVGGLLNPNLYPDGAYAAGMFFATLCTAGLWVGFDRGVKRESGHATWLDATFCEHKLYWSGALLCVFGFFFQHKLTSLPAEMLAQTQWSGAVVKYLFLASVFKFGFLALWILYLRQPKLIVPKLLLFLTPCLLMLLDAAVLRGRRAGMMNLAAYILVGLWFVRRKLVPRWLIATGLVAGLTLINAIGTYRSIMGNRDATLGERLSAVSKADYTSSSKKMVKKSGSEFVNYIFYRQLYEDVGKYDFGLIHWNGLVANYVPAQIIGRELKQSFMFPLLNIASEAKQRYGHSFVVGSTVTGFCDAFGSFGWFGFVKFIAIGWIMGVLYRHAMHGAFLAQLLYLYSLGTAMQAITHATHPILCSIWVYFIALGYPVLHFAKGKERRI